MQTSSMLLAPTGSRSFEPGNSKTPEFAQSTNRIHVSGKNSTGKLSQRNRFSCAALQQYNTLN
jgi:LysM repeat protein